MRTSKKLLKKKKSQKFLKSTKMTILKMQKIKRKTLKQKKLQEERKNPRGAQELSFLQMRLEGWLLPNRPNSKESNVRK